MQNQLFPSSASCKLTCLKVRYLRLHTEHFSWLETPKKRNLNVKENVCNAADATLTHIAVFVATGMREFCKKRMSKLMLSQKFATHEEDHPMSLLPKELRFHLVWYVNMKTETRQQESKGLATVTMRATNAIHMFQKGDGKRRL